MFRSTRRNSRNAAYRRIIAELIQALCAVPADAREEWASELLEKGQTSDALPPDESVVCMVLINLNVADRVANRRREEEKPKLYPIVGREIARRRAGRAGSEARPSGPGDADDAPPAA